MQREIPRCLFTAFFSQDNGESRREDKACKHFSNSAAHRLPSFQLLQLVHGFPFLLRLHACFRNIELKRDLSLFPRRKGSLDTKKDSKDATL